jgi:hypothetical protein
VVAVVFAAWRGSEDEGGGAGRGRMTAERDATTSRVRRPLLSRMVRDDPWIARTNTVRVVYEAPTRLVHGSTDPSVQRRSVTQRPWGWNR